MVASKSRCNRGVSEITKGRVSDIQTCADKCRGVSTMFLYQQQSYCDIKDGCECYCEVTENFGRPCEFGSDDGYDLYRLPGNYCFMRICKHNVLDGYIA